jgi:hypothetical protein
MGGHAACMGKTKGVYMILMGKPKGQRPLERHRHRWKDNIKTDIQAVGCGGLGLICLRKGIGGGHF